MIHPAPTTPLAPGLARGVLVESVPATATRLAYVKLSFANTSYVMHLLPTLPIKAEPGDKVFGTIHARARRVDVVPSGGKYVEPVIGRPRRVQGRVIGHVEVPGGDQLVIDAGVPMHFTLVDARQHARDFAVGDLVSFDVLDGACFSPKADG
ncbi:MAG: hypothetical protein KIT54_08355 [Phycisphaeraceae bacterium]|nr:hypothetical protein [Phycisphaeraceae bacterium]